MVLKISDRLRIYAIVTRHSAAELGLAVGKPATALVGSSFVILAHAGEIGRSPARNAIEGTVTKIDDGAVSTEITLDLGHGLLIARARLERQAKQQRAELDGVAAGLTEFLPELLERRLTEKAPRADIDCETSDGLGLPAPRDADIRLGPFFGSAISSNL